MVGTPTTREPGPLAERGPAAGTVSWSDARQISSRRVAAWDTADCPVRARLRFRRRL